ncbi:MAG: InlB B-repeat-containing protein, partial [Clostridia bacterium]|nr:InlB B-repeat-containing protein [Clostridia bacterium]
MEKVFNLVKKTIIIFLVFFVSQTNTKTIQTDRIIHKEADPSQWTAVDGLGRTISNNDGKSSIKNTNNQKEVGIFFWNWHDTETIMYIRDSWSTLPPEEAFKLFKKVEPYNIQNALDKYPKADPYNPNSEVWEGRVGHFWWNEPIYGYYLNNDYWVLRKQAELLADAGVDFILLDYTNNSGVGSSFTNQRNSEKKYIRTDPKGSRQLYSENRFSYCWDWHPLFTAFQQAKAEGVNVPKIGFMLSFEAGSSKGTNDMLLCLYDSLYKDGNYKDLWYKKNGSSKPLIMSYSPDKTSYAKFSSSDQNKLKEIESFFEFRSSGTTNVGSVIDVKPVEKGWMWESLYPQSYGTVSGKIEEVSVSPAQNVGYNSNGTSRGAAMNSSNSRGRNMPRNDKSVTSNSKYKKYTGNYSYKYRNKEITVNDKTSNNILYGRNFQQQWDYAISLDPDVVFVTGWNEWVVGKNTDAGTGKTVFVDQYNDQKSRDIEPSKGKLKDYYYYQLADNIRKFKGASKLTSQTYKKTIDITKKEQWDDKKIISYDHYTKEKNNSRYRNTCRWGSGAPCNSYINNTFKNDLKTAKVSYDGANIYFYIETNEAFKDYKNKTRLLIDTIEHITNTSTKNWEEFEYILNREGATDTTLRLERSKGGWNWEKVADVEYTVDNNVMQVSIPRKYLELTSNNIKFNFKWTDNNLTNGDIMTLYTDGDAAPGGRFAFHFEGLAPINSVNIKYHVNGGSLSKTHGSNIGKTGNYITVDNSDIVKKLYYKEKTTSDGLPNYNNKGAINIERKGYKTLSGQEFIDADGKTYGQAKVYSSEDFCDILQESCTKELKVNWTPIEYKIVYKINGATFGSSHPTTGKYNSVINIDNPTKKGYTFTGWTASNINNSTSRIGSTKTTVSDNWDGANPTKNKYFKNLSATDKAEITMTANFTPITYKITYNLNGGTNPNNRASYTVETANFTLTNPTKKGYTFTGWTEEGKEEKVKTVTIAKGTTGNKTFTANWTPTNYKITYNLNDGEDPKNPEKYTIETNTFTLKNPVKDGYTFTGWTGSGLSSESKEVSITKGTIGNKEYTANWNINKLIIRFLMNGGTLSEKHGSTISTSGDYITLNNSKNIQTVEYNSSLPSAGLSNYNNSAAINIEKKGYKAVSKKEWIDTKGNTFDQAVQYKQSDFCDVTKSNCTIDLKVNWTPVTYKITYNLNGGTNPNNPKNYTVETETFNINNPVKEGFTFSGWKDEKGNVNANVKITKGTVGNKTLEALWEPNKYQITYNTNGGTTLPVQTVNYQAQIEEPEAPTKAGYTFTGWYEDQALTELYTFNEMPNKNITLYAGWKANTYTITYKMNGGTNNKSNPSSYQTGEEKTLLTPTKTGYTFKGWYTDSAFKNKIEKITSNMNKNITVYASWEAIEYQITFNSNGGSAVSPIKGIYKTKIEEPEAPTKTGYTFTGWYEDQALTELYTFSQMPNKNITLYAGWTSNAYTITYKMNGGTNNKSNPSSYQTGEEKTLLTPTKTGYTFKGWYTDSAFKNKIEKITSNMNKNITVYASWEAIEYQITFNSNGGSAVNPIKGIYKTKIEEPEAPTKTGYTFTGWHEDQALTELYTFNEMPNKNITLYAGWTAKANVITYKMNGGTNNKSNPSSYQTGEEKTLLTPTKTGYTFKGWYTDSTLKNKIEKITSSMNKNITLYAGWTINKYQITFDSNGGSTVNPITQEYNTKIEKPTSPTKEGYLFIDWYTDEQLTKTYTFSKMPNKNITLYAGWEEKINIVSFNTYGGSELSQISIKDGEKLVEPKAPEKEGYTFVGWYTDESFSTTYNFDTAVKNDLNLYAKWNIKKYTITYNTNGGNNIEKAEVEYGSKIENLPTPTKTGYTFQKWTLNKTTQAPPETMPAKNITLKANWKQNEYTIAFNTNGGNEINSITEKYNENIEEIQTPVKKGYKFAGWYKDKELTEVYTLTQMPAENITLYAKWTENENIIYYVTNGGELDKSSPTTFTTGRKTELKAPQKDGYEFEGWYTSEQYNEKVTSINTNNDEDIVLYAKWADNKYTISFNTNGGSTISQIKGNYGDEIEQPINPTKKGYNFIGWYTDPELTEEYEFDTIPSENITLYAGWVEEDKNIIRFNTNGGSNVNIIEAYALDKIEKPNDPVKEGFKFAGWFKDEQLTELYSFTVMPTEDITLYAKWITNDVNKIEYILNGGSNDTNNPVEYEIGKEIILNNPTKEGYVFGGWYTDENYSNKIEKITKNMQGDIKLYAKWYSSGLIVNVPQTLANIKTIIIIIGSLLLTVSILTIAY